MRRDRGKRAACFYFFFWCQYRLAIARAMYPYADASPPASSPALYLLIFLSIIPFFPPRPQVVWATTAKLSESCQLAASPPSSNWCRWTEPSPSRPACPPSWEPGGSGTRNSWSSCLTPKWSRIIRYLCQCRLNWGAINRLDFTSLLIFVQSEKQE